MSFSIARVFAPLDPGHVDEAFTASFHGARTNLSLPPRPLLGASQRSLAPFTHFTKKPANGFDRQLGVESVETHTTVSFYSKALVSFYTIYLPWFHLHNGLAPVPLHCA